MRVGMSASMDGGVDAFRLQRVQQNLMNLELRHSRSFLHLLFLFSQVSLSLIFYQKKRSRLDIHVLPTSFDQDT